MEKLPMCRICLVENVRMYVVVNKNLHELYEKLTDVPFVTEDSRPMLACFFCCTKLKQCYRFLRKCLEAEEMFALMMDEDCETDVLINPEHLEFFNGFVKCPIVHISTDDGQTESDAIKEGLPAVTERLEIIDPKEGHQTDELDLKNVDNSYSDVKDTSAHYSDFDSEDGPLMEIKTEVEDEQESIVTELDLKTVYPDVIDTPAHHSESDSEDVPLMEIKTEEEDEQGSIVTELDLINVDNSCSDVKDTPTYHSESDSEDVHLMEIKTEVEDEQESIGAPAAKKPKLVPQKEDMENSVSLKHKNNGQKHSKNTENSKNVKSIHKTEKAISNRTVIKGKPKVTNDTICNNKDAIGTKSQENTALLQCDKINKDEYKCKICFSKGNSSDIKSHTRSLRYNNVCAKDRPYTCDICQSSFKQKCNLNDHIRTHTVEKRYKCDICQSSFSERGNLKRHIRNIHIRKHIVKKPFVCDICQSSFAAKTYLNIHIRTHTDEKPYECDICQSSFKQSGHLKTHIRTHTGEKPYKCDICRSSFTTKSYLNVHMRTHSGEKPYKCDICQSSFTELGSLKRHNRNIHIRKHIVKKPH